MNLINISCILVKNALVVLLNNSFISVKYKYTFKTVIILSNMINKGYNMHRKFIQSCIEKYTLIFIKYCTKIFKFNN